MVSSGILPKTLFYEALNSQVNVPRHEVLVDVDKQLQKSGRFVALQGNSGGGKSYFLRHQLVPFYEQPIDEKVSEVEGPWRVVTFSPQINPIGTLAKALAAPGMLKAPGDSQPFYREQIERELRSGNDGLVNVYREAIEAGGKPFRLLIVVDQLEDMFKMGDELHKDRSERYTGLGDFFQAGDDTLFFNLFLKVLTTELPVYLLFSIGSENLDRLNAFQGWPERISMHRYGLPQISLEEMQHALLAFWPVEEEQPMPEGARQLYGQLLRDYKNYSSENRESAARVNIALKLLYQHSFDLLDRPFAKLANPPQFVKRALEEGETASQRATLIREKFLLPDNQTEWLNWLDKAPSEEMLLWEKEIANFFSSLQRYYQGFGGLGGAPNYLFNRLYQQLSEEEQALTGRLFQTITLKDASPDRVAESYSTPFGILREVCFRNGEEYPDLLHTLGHGIGFEEETKQEAEEKANDALRQVIHHFNFRGGTIPDLVRWINPAGHVDGPQEAFLHDKTIIKLGANVLVQEWSELHKWVEEEYVAANIYKKLVQDAKLHFQDELDRPQEETANQNLNPPIPQLSLLRDAWESLSGVMSKMWQRKPKEKAKSKQLDRTLLSEGGVELVGEWFQNTLPSSFWAAKYRPEQIIADAGDEAPTPFQEWVKAGEWKAFSLATAFWEKSRSYHLRQRKNELAEVEQRMKSQERILRWMKLALIVAGICVVVAVVLGNQARTARNNLSLLDFVDSMTKADLIPAHIYRSAVFGQLKEEVETNRSITEKEDVIKALYGWGILSFPREKQLARYRDLSTTALLQLDLLIDNYHETTALSLEAITKDIIDTADSTMAQNDSLSEVAYQYPYVYQALWENFGTLTTALQGPNDPGVIYATNARIASVVANPDRLTDQYAVGDATGRVKIFERENVLFDRVSPLPESISSLLYSPTGEQLFASTFGGNIYRYDSLIGRVNENSLLGRTDSLRWRPLKVKWGVRGDSLAILSIHNVAPSSKYDQLLVVGDSNVTLIRRRKGSSGSYYAVKNFPLGKKLASLTVAGGNAAGTKFMIGGSEASVLLSFDPATEKMDIVRTIVHKNVSVSAIAFQPITASRDRASSTDQPSLQRVAVGTETGDIWMTNVQAFSASGPLQEELMKKIDGRMATKENSNYQESGISGLAFNFNGNEQLVSSSLDGTVWVYNLEATPQQVSNDFLEDGQKSGSWDHLRLKAANGSVNNLCLINSEKVITIENNTIRYWPTNLATLRDEVNELLTEYELLHQ